jgi:hypothetical protein
LYFLSGVAGFATKHGTAVRFGRPEIFNIDQRSPLTSAAFTDVLMAAGLRISTYRQWSGLLDHGGAQGGGTRPIRQQRLASETVSQPQRPLDHEH